MINTHPSLLPKYGGRGFYGDHIHKAVIAGGDTETGCTIHYVNEEYDSGDIILQTKIPVDPRDTATTLAEKVKREEKIILIQTLQQLLGSDTL
jgi:phosphoribosylglycinamide formyltransferase-1